MLLQGDLLDDGYVTHLAFAFIYLVLLVIWIIRRKSLLSNLMLILNILYLHLLFVLLFLPIPIDAKGIQSFRDSTFTGDPYYNIIPFKDIITFVCSAVRSGSVGMMIRNIFGNILCFIPLGFLLPCLNKSLLNLKKFIFVALLVPTGVELTQFIVSFSIKAVYRFADIDDVILNLTGTLIGFAVLKLLAKCINKRFQIDVFDLIFRQRKTLHLFKKTNSEQNV